MIDTTASSRSRRLRELVSRGRPLAALGATDAMSARLIESQGFECVYIGSYGTAASRFALPDVGLILLEDLVEHAATVAHAVNVPVIADAEGGFQDPGKTVRAFEDAGVAAIHIEDHTGAGKHTTLPQTLRPKEEMAERIRAAFAARTDPEFMIVARSDAFWVSRDLQDCIARLQAYAEAGADMVFPTGVGPAELAEVRRRIAKPAMVIDMPRKRLDQHAGAAIVLFYAFSLLVQFEALERALEKFKQKGAFTGRVRELEELLGYGRLDAPLPP